MAEKLLREAHEARGKVSARGTFALDPTRAVSMGLKTPAYAHLLRLGGFLPLVPRPLADAAHGPPAPLRWRWRPPRRLAERGPEPAIATPPRREGAFAALADMVR
jgi:ATP-dependent RNA helicase SUPV3L1/SUV3